MRIPLPDDKVLRVVGERPEKKARLLMSAKASKKKQEEIVVVRDFPEVFPDDLSGLPPIRKIEFRIELTLGATLVAKTKVSFNQVHRLGERCVAVFSRKIDLRLDTINERCDEDDIPQRTAFRTRYGLSSSQSVNDFDWGEEQELEFQTLKNKLCNAHILALPNGPEDFVIWRTLSVWIKSVSIWTIEFQHIFSQKEFNMWHPRWIELFSDYDCEIRYHPGKANVVADSLSKKERVKPKRVRAMNMILQSSIKDRIRATQKEDVDEFA
ncbi:hypothetical protein Tco_0464262 [Tanacetum coccineum]